MKEHLDDTNGSIVIADIFEKRDIERMESMFKDHFVLEKKEIITINVKHAMNLDKPRIEKIV
jgi:hypothetical protein